MSSDVPLYARAIEPLFFVIPHEAGLVWHVDENPVHVDEYNRTPSQVGHLS
jgi:hypothetical protein